MKGPLDPIRVGADIGNATTTIAVDDQVVSFLPSFVSPQAGEYEGMSRITTDRHHIVYGRTAYVVGADAPGEMGYDSLLTKAAPGEEWRRYTSDRAIVVFLAALSAAYPQADRLAVRLATGAPMSVYEEHGAAIAKRYSGEHRYTYNGHERIVNVVECVVHGEGSQVMTWVDPALRLGNVVVHDIGGRTYNAIAYKDGAMIGKPKTLALGVEHLLDRVAVSSDPAARFAMLGKMRGDAKAHADVRRRLIDLLGVGLETLNGKINLSKVHRHLVIGGGAEFLAAALRVSALTGGEVITLGGDRPETVNALSYAAALHATKARKEAA